MRPIARSLLGPVTIDISEPDKVHSEGTIIVPRVAVDNPDKVKNIVLIGAVAQKVLDLQYYQEVMARLLYAQKVLDKGHHGMLSVVEASADPMFQRPAWFRSHAALDSTLSMIGNVSSHISILIQQGENDSQVPLEQGLLLQEIDGGKSP